MKGCFGRSKSCIERFASAAIRVIGIRWKKRAYWMRRTMLPRVVQVFLHTSELMAFRRVSSCFCTSPGLHGVSPEDMISMLCAVRTVTSRFTIQQMISWDPCYAGTVLYLDVGTTVLLQPHLSPASEDACGWCWVRILHGAGVGRFAVAQNRGLSGWIHPGIVE